MKNINDSFHVIGLMSGTSLDGTDLLHAEFFFKHGRWNFLMHEAETLPYSTRWQNRLKEAVYLDGLSLSLLDVELGHLLGEHIRSFIKKHKLAPDFAAVHGHTIFHQPAKKLSLQIGHGAAISVEADCMVINQFRNQDVALGGQGAPLVPIGDKLLFSEYDVCINLGGIANLSFTKNEKRIAFDTSVCNMALNYIAQKKGRDFDEKGAWAKNGTILPDLLQSLNQLEYYQLKGPKSLGFEWFSNEFQPLLDHTNAKAEDILHTLCLHIAVQLASIIRPLKIKKILLTGGGALNDFLCECIEKEMGQSVEKADPKLIEYKEALIFAFLGVLRYLEIPNCLTEISGAQRDHIGGAIWLR